MTDAQRKSRIRTLAKYGLTLESYAAKLAEQGGCCAICNRKPPKWVNLHVDHNHRTGVTRGLLCAICNGRVLARVEKYRIDPQKIVDYLKKYPN